MDQNNSVLEPALLIGERTVSILRSIVRTTMLQAPEVASRLLEEIDRADVIREEELPADVVTLGSFVTYRVVLTGAINTVRIVCPHEAHPAQLRVSVASALGTALIGLKPAQRIGCNLGERWYVLEVVRVSTEL